MTSKQEYSKEEGEGKKKFVDRSANLFNPNADEQVQVLIHLLMRAKQKKLDILGIVWEDTDNGKSTYCDWFDLPSKELTDMLKHLEKTVTLS